ncbi:Methyl-accepting chemotaxis protein I (serine chemoreceptor protein) [Rhodovulum sp. P5]|uniref:methyl-accepting chemotaxis protein n=1 Tax=Rhodovulum sp. P5 TaxID=1564506 RepID=UPI0009C2DE24|nr:methyl-accepting chemotaxis protein [Rhodovulum sp. P5]ARE38628.1 Methyl-accepting chemotaxis protein I (serine chemoreceptor protein) [Rhodovulum sp. P5]
MKIFKSLSIRVALAVGTALLMLTLSITQVVVLEYQTEHAMTKAAQQRQTTSLHVLVDQFSSEFGGIEVRGAAGGDLERVTWDALPEIADHSVIDHVGSISGETATLFKWDEAQGDFLRVSTNIKKPDGSRAVGTMLGRKNPVHAAMLRKETYRGEALILGKEYLTIYQPILSPAGQVIGIFYVGVDRGQIDAAIVQQRFLSVLVSGILILAALGLMIWMLNVLLRPLGKLGKAFDRMAGGDLDTLVPYTDRKNEIGEIATRADAFRVKLVEARQRDEEAHRKQEQEAKVVQTLREGLERLAAGNLTRSLDQPFPPNYEALRMDFNATLDTLNDLLGAIVETTSEIRGKTEEISSASDDLSRRTENQAATLEETAAALDELTSSVRSAAESASEVENVVKSARKDAENSGRVVEDAIGAMSGIKRSSDEINQIIGVIDDIAFQTNLLALNAGVEAARAGEAGRGFAVVASEVRALAQRSSEAAKEIKQLIAASAEQVDSGVSLVNRAGEALTDIVSRVGTIAELISEIATGSQEQSVGLGEINVGVTELDKVTQQNAAMVEEVTAASTTLKSESTTLDTMVERFQLRREGRRTAPAPVMPRESAAPAPMPRAAERTETHPPARKVANGGDWQDF